jgi:succinate dehydrogenase/fumarate reductase flavoprotein subunit
MPTVDKDEVARLKKILAMPLDRKGGFSPRWVAQVLQNTMTPYFIKYIKHGDRLQAGLTTVEFLRDHIVPKLFARDGHELWLAHETKNMVQSAEMILRSSLFRTESRGNHYREDYPRRNDAEWLAWVKIQERGGRMALWKEPIPKQWWPDFSRPYEELYPRRFPGE